MSGFQKQYAKVEVFNAGIKGWGLRAAEPLEPYVLTNCFSEHCFCHVCNVEGLFLVRSEFPVLRFAKYNLFLIRVFQAGWLYLFCFC